jgi:hypothetical protein
MRADDAARLEAERIELKKRLKAEQGVNDAEADRLVDWGRDAVNAGTDAFLGFRPNARSWQWTAVGFAALAAVAFLLLWFQPNGP